MLQEYCAAQRIVTVDEDDSTRSHEGSDVEDGETSATPEELALFSDLRAEIQALLPDCRPFWLFHGFDPDTDSAHVSQFVTRYHELAARVWCQVEEDKLRALCPLLANVPVSTQLELRELLRQAEEISGQSLTHGNADIML